MVQQSQLAAILGSDFPSNSAASISGVSVGSSSSSGIGTSRASSASSKCDEETSQREDEVCKLISLVFLGGFQGSIG